MWRRIAVIVIISGWLVSAGAAQDLNRGVLVGPAPKTEAGRQRWALIIGINDYTNVTSLRYGRSDAEAPSDVLINKCGFPKDNIVLEFQNVLCFRVIK